MSSRTGCAEVSPPTFLPVQRLPTSSEMNYLSLSDKDLSVQPTRKDKIIDLTIVSTVVAGKVSGWKVQQEVYLNTDHNLVSFEYGKSEVESKWERLDFKNADC